METEELKIGSLYWVFGQEKRYMPRPVRLLAMTEYGYACIAVHGFEAIRLIVSLHSLVPLTDLENMEYALREG